MIANLITIKHSGKRWAVTWRYPHNCTLAPGLGVQYHRVFCFAVKDAYRLVRFLAMQGELAKVRVKI